MNVAVAAWLDSSNRKNLLPRIIGRILSTKTATFITYFFSAYDRYSVQFGCCILCQIWIRYSRMKNTDFGSNQWCFRLPGFFCFVLFMYGGYLTAWYFSLKVHKRGFLSSYSQLPSPCPNFASLITRYDCAQIFVSFTSATYYSEISDRRDGVLLRLLDDLYW